MLYDAQIFCLQDHHHHNHKASLPWILLNFLAKDALLVVRVCVLQIAMNWSWHWISLLLLLSSNKNILRAHSSLKDTDSLDDVCNDTCIWMQFCIQNQASQVEWLIKWMRASERAEDDRSHSNTIRNACVYLRQTD